MDNRNVGQSGEKIAANYLQKKGYKILHKNFHTHWGEIDIIAEKNNKLCFIEVKTRINTSYGQPYEAVTDRKVQHLMRPINYFLLQKKYKDYKLSLDVVSIILNANKTINEIKHFENIYR